MVHTLTKVMARDGIMNFMCSQGTAKPSRVSQTATERQRKHRTRLRHKERTQLCAIRQRYRYVDCAVCDAPVGYRLRRRPTRVRNVVYFEPRLAKHSKMLDERGEVLLRGIVVGVKGEYFIVKCKSVLLALVSTELFDKALIE